MCGCKHRSSTPTILMLHYHGSWSLNRRCLPRLRTSDMPWILEGFPVCASKAWEIANQENKHGFVPITWNYVTWRICLRIGAQLLYTHSMYTYHSASTVPTLAGGHSIPTDHISKPAKWKKIKPSRKAKTIIVTYKTRCCDLQKDWNSWSFQRSHVERQKDKKPHSYRLGKRAFLHGSQSQSQSQS